MGIKSFFIDLIKYDRNRFLWNNRVVLSKQFGKDFFLSAAIERQTESTTIYPQQTIVQSSQHDARSNVSSNEGNTDVGSPDSGRRSSSPSSGFYR